MRKNILLLTFSYFLNLGLQSQTFIEENFDSYDAGEYLTLQSDLWSTWSGNGSGTSEDSFVSDEQSASGTNSLLCLGGGSTDLILPLNNINEGEYTVDISLYVPSGNGAYYNFQEDTTPAIGWAFEIYFSEDGSWEIIQDQIQIANGNYTHNSWFRMSHVIDLINDDMTFYQEGIPVASLDFDSPIGAINIYPTAPSGQNAMFYVDDIYVYKSKEDLEDYVNGSLLGNVSQQWSTWTGNGSGTVEDGSVSNLYSSNGINSANFSGTECNVIYPMGNFTSGKWNLSMKLYTPIGSGGALNIQHDTLPGASIASQLYFGGSEGSLDAGGTSIANFVWTDGEWHQLTYLIDLGNDFTELMINGVPIYSWNFSDEATSMGTGLPILGNLNFYPNENNVGNGNFYLDNLTFRRTDLATFIPYPLNAVETFTIHPNPAKDIAFISSEINIALYTECRVYDTSGRLLYDHQKLLEPNSIIQLNTTKWPSGLYFVELISNRANKTIKLIVEGN
ncbi:MAG: T9SS type A sorting domain-containing protein [Flavobacteriales bacterium]|nr:T9SS type A sorting domain-containing protein [Flavobacteriales bacterium]